MANSERVAAIAARLAALQPYVNQHGEYHYADDFADPAELEFLHNASADIAFLLSELADRDRELAEAMATLEELTSSWDNENRQKNRIYAALELQSDILADALGKKSREGLSYMDMIAEVKHTQTALGARGDGQRVNDSGEA